MACLAGNKDQQVNKQPIAPAKCFNLPAQRIVKSDQYEDYQCRLVDDAMLCLVLK